jgi:hypothetical protein
MNIPETLNSLFESTAKKFSNIFNEKTAAGKDLSDFMPVFRHISCLVSNDLLVTLFVKILNNSDVTAMINAGDIILSKTPGDPFCVRDEINRQYVNISVYGRDWDVINQCGCGTLEETEEALLKTQFWIDDSRNRINELMNNEMFLLHLKSTRLAYLYYKTASLEKDPEALWRLGWRYYLNDYCFREEKPQDYYKMAIECWSEAAKNGHGMAMEKLKELSYK